MQGEQPHLVLRTAGADDDQGMSAALVRDLALGLARLPDLARSESLTLPLGLSLWTKRNHAGVPELIDALLRLRAAVLEVAGLDPRAEPVPLLLRDQRTSAINLAIYVSGLLERAAAFRSTPPEAIAEEAVATLPA